MMNDILFYFQTKVPSYVFMISFAVMAVVILMAVIGRRRYEGSSKRIVLVALLTEYYFLTICSTVVFRGAYGMTTRLQVMPFWNYKVIASWKDPRNFWEVVLNMVLFMPIGMLVGGWSRKVRWYHVMGIGICLSAVIEALQYVFNRGLCETDDVIHNTLGCMIGLGLYKLIFMVYKKNGKAMRD